MTPIAPSRDPICDASSKPTLTDSGQCISPGSDGEADIPMRLWHSYILPSELPRIVGDRCSSATAMTALGAGDPSSLSNVMTMRSSTRRV